MTWIQSPASTRAYSDIPGYLDSRPPTKYHLLGEWIDGNTWVAACDIKARQYAHFKVGNISSDPDNKCGRCKHVANGRTK